MVHVFGQLDRETKDDDGYDELVVALARSGIDSSRTRYLDEAAHSEASLDALHADMSMSLRDAGRVDECGAWSLST